VNTPKSGTIEYRRYGDWMICRIVERSGPMYDLGNLHNETLERLYTSIVQDATHPYSAYQTDVRRDR